MSLRSDDGAARPAAHAQPRPEPERTRWAPVAALGLAMLAVTSEMTLAAVTLPGIGAELGVDPSATAWVLLAYALPMAALGIPAGRWGDGADVRSVFLLSQAAIAVSCVISAAAPSYWLLLVGRVLQGAAAALVMAAYMPLVTTSVRPAQRGRAMSFVITIMTVGGMAGAPLGGVVAGAAGWRAVFLMKLPLVAAALLIGWRSIRRTSRGLPRPGPGPVREAALLGGAVAALLLGFEFVADRPVVAGGAGVLAVGLAAGWSRLSASGPVLSLVRRPELAGTLVALLTVSMTSGLPFFLVPYLVTDVLGGTAEQTGLVMLFLVGAIALVSPLAGSMTDRYGPRRLAAAGAFLLALALATVLTLGPDTGLPGLVWRLALFGVATGLFNTPINTAVLAASPAGREGTAGGVAMTVRALAMTIGPAVTALAWTVAGGGVTAVRAGTTVLLAATLAGLAALAVRPRGG